MSIIYRIISSNDSALRQMGEEGWILSCISEGKMYFWKEEKKTRSKKELNLEGFELFWHLYPRKVSKGNAKVAWNRLDNKTRELCILGIKRYKEYWKKENIETKFIPHASTWLNLDDERWNDDLSSIIPVIKTDNEEKLRKEQEEEREIEREKKWNQEQLDKLKGEGKYDEAYTKARDSLPEGQRKFEMIVRAKMIANIRNQ